MKKKVLSIVSVVLVLCMVVVGTNTMAFAGKKASDKNATNKTKTEEKTTTSSDEWAKDETAYVITGGSGNVQKTIVSDWLQNGHKADTIIDATTLSNIKNVKGDEKFDKTANGVCWKAAGNDIYYQGTTKEAPPVGISITYFLNGKETSPKALQGKSGNVKIVVRYTNNSRVATTVKGTNYSVCVPFAAVTSMIFDDKNFSNVSIDNGQVVSDGNRIVAVGIGIPGLKSSLGLSGTSVSIPEGFTISATAKDFNVDTMLSIVTNSLLNDLDINAGSSTGDIEKQLNKLNATSEKLVSGTAELYANANKIYAGGAELLDGSKKLVTNTGKIKAGTHQLNESSIELGEYLTQLAAGLSTLDGKSAELVGGAKQVYETMLASANKQITEGGISLPAELTIANNQTVLKGVIAKMTDENLTALAQAAAQEKVRKQVLAGAFGGAKYDSLNEAQKVACDQAVTANMASAQVQEQINEGIAKGKAGRESLNTLKTQLESYDQFYEGLIQYTEGVNKAAKSAGAISTGVNGKEGLVEGTTGLAGYMDQLYDGTVELEQGCTRYVGYVGALAKGCKKLDTGVNQFNEEGIQKIMKVYNGDVKELANKLQALGNASTAYSNFSGISSGMKGKIKFIYKTSLE